MVEGTGSGGFRWRRRSRSGDRPGGAAPPCLYTSGDPRAAARPACRGHANLRYWAVTADIPTALVLPCYGAGAVEFVPNLTSTTARNATVPVTFVGQP